MASQSHSQAKNMEKQKPVLQRKPLYRKNPEVYSQVEARNQEQTEKATA
jgi:hypothetical protein